MISRNSGKVVQPNPHRTEAWKNRFILSKKHRLCYAAVDKAACTTLKWWMAEIEGAKEGVLVFLEQNKGRPAASKGIHGAYGVVAPQLVLRSFGQVRAAFSSGGYFCFAVVRNPYSRVFSVWSDKVLKGRHDHTRLNLAAGDIHRQSPTTTDEVRASFESFVSYLHDVPGLLLANRHWIPQYYLLRPDLLPYDCIAKLEQPDELKRSLAGILGEAYVDPLRAGDAKNTSLLRYHPDFLTPKAREIIRTIYAEDFSRFGYDPFVLPSGKGALVPGEVETILLRQLKARTRYAYRRLALLEEEKMSLERNPVKAFATLLHSLFTPLRNIMDRIRHVFLRV